MPKIKTARWMTQNMAMLPMAYGGTSSIRR
jgi:hypothetical protein